MVSTYYKNSTDYVFPISEGILTFTQYRTIMLKLHSTVRKRIFTRYEFLILKIQYIEYD
jgi:hypothetical protein